METNDIAERITALVDDEINDNDEIKRLLEVIDHDYSVRIEYLIQSNLKAAIKTHVQFINAPNHLQTRIIQLINREAAFSPSKKKSQSLKVGKVFTPKYAVAAVFGVIILLSAAFLFYFSTNNTSNDQGQIHNLLSLARQNFQKIAEGKLPLQFVSSSVQGVKQFFKENGVKFDPIVPEFTDWALQGAVVSNNNGEKLPHNVYKGKDGKLVYLYQVDENCLKNNVVSLSSNVSEMLDSGKCYKVTDGSQSALVWKCKGKVCVVVSNDNINKVESRFMAIQENW